MSKRKTTTPTLKLLRAGLLIGLVGFVALVIVLYRFGRSGMPGTVEPADSAAEEAAGQPAVMAGRGFDYTISQDERPIARIRAERVVSERENEVLLEGIDPVEVYREGGAIYRVFSDRGTYDLDTQETELTGNVRLEGPRGLSLESRVMSMSRRGQMVTSRTPVRFRMAGEYEGRARRLQANLDNDLFLLDGAVQIHSTSAEREPVRMTAKRIAYHRQDGMIRAVGDVRFVGAGGFLRAAEMQFFLTEDEAHVRYVSAQQGVTGRFVKRFGESLYRTAEIDADELAVVLDPATGDPLEAELRSPEGVARLAATDEASMVRQMTAPVVHARFRGGEVRYAEAVGLVHLREYPSFDAANTITWGCGQRAEVWFDASGEIQQARFYERVEFRQARGLANGDRLDLSPDSAEMTMVGEPARFVNAEGELTAPAIVRRTESGEIHAVGGVRGRFEQTDGGLSVGGAEGVIRLEAREAVWNPQTESFRFQDDVRVWQQENLLLAQLVETFTERNLVVARGGVKTILEPERDPEEAETETVLPAGAGTDGEAAPGIGDEPIHITSVWMEYELDRRVARYHDQVVMTQAGRRMTCQTAEAELAEEGGIETLLCSGRATVVDSVAGRTVSGETAYYEVARGEILFHGKPVQMTGDQGERVEGAALVYDLRTGGARITSASSSGGVPEPPPKSLSEEGSEEASEPPQPPPNPPGNRSSSG